MHQFMQKHLNKPPYCGSPCYVVTLCSFSISMVTTILITHSIRQSRVTLTVSDVEKRVRKLIVTYLKVILFIIYECKILFTDFIG